MLMPSGMSEHGLTGLQACMVRMGLAKFAERVTLIRKLLFFTSSTAETKVRAYTAGFIGVPHLHNADILKGRY